MEEHCGGDDAAVNAHDSWRLDINHFRLEQSSTANVQSSILRRLLLPTTSNCICIHTFVSYGAFEYALKKIFV